MYSLIKIGKISTSRIELRDLTKAWLAISFTFAVLQLGINLFEVNSFSRLATTDFFLVIVISLFTVGIGFLLHELAHKIVAQHYGCLAEFRAFNQMLLLAFFLALIFGFTFIAPGAVMIAGQITRRENGLISFAGPLTNYLLAVVFTGLQGIVPSLGFLWTMGVQINLFLGLFNLIPFGNFDGLKIFHWNIYVWAVMVAFGILSLFWL